MTTIEFLATSRRAYPILGPSTFWATNINKSVKKGSFWTIGYLRSEIWDLRDIWGPVWRVGSEGHLEVILRSF